MAFDTLAAILYDENIFTQLWATSYVITAVLFLNLLLYSFRLVLILAAVEEPGPHYLDRTSAALNIDMINLETFDESDGRIASRQQHLFRRTKLSRRKQALYPIWKRIQPLRLAFWHSYSETNEVVTRNLAATVRQLRYHSGSGVYFTRGLLLYLFWYRVLPATVEMIANIVAWIALRLFLWVVRAKYQGRMLFFTDLVSTLVARGVYFAIASEYIAFHTIRVLSVSTQITTNVVTEYWDPKLYDLHRGPYRWPPLLLATSGVLYGIAAYIPNLVAYLIVYGPGEVKFLDVAPEMYTLLVRATLWRFLLVAILTVPSIVVFTKLQAQLVSPKEPTIVRYRLHNCVRSFRAIVANTNWLRIHRVLVQCFIVGGISAAAVILVGSMRVSDFKQASMIKPWVYKSFLDPRWNIGLTGYWGTLNFWHQNTLLVVDPWGWVLLHDEDFDRWLVFGDETKSYVLDAHAARHPAVPWLHTLDIVKS